VSSSIRTNGRRTHPPRSRSGDGTHLAFSIQEGGTDWRTIRVLDIESGATLDDEIRWARFTNIAWVKDGSGFFYSRNPEPKEDAAFVAPALGHAVYFHRLGTPQSEDKLIRAPEAEYPLIHTVDVTADGRYAVIYLDSPHRRQRARNRGPEEF
jgi:prolyl oligopeptidase